MSRLKRLLSAGWALPLLILLFMYVVYMYSSVDVLTLESTADLLNNAAPLVIAATGLTLVIIAGGFDLSIGGVVVLANVIIASHSGSTALSGAISIVAALVAGLVVGAVNGFLVAYLRVQSIAATLGTFIMCSGLALVIMPSPGGSVPNFISPGLTSSLGGTVPITFLVILGCILGWLALRRTRFGVFVYAVGIDEGSAIQSGIPTRRVTFRVYLSAGLFYALSGVMLTAQTASGDPNGSALFVVLVFAAVAIGGARFGGGRGSAVSSILGAGVLAVLQKMLFAVGVSTFYTGIVQGLVLILAVLIGLASLRLSEQTPRTAVPDKAEPDPRRDGIVSGSDR